MAMYILHKKEEDLRQFYEKYLFLIAIMLESYSITEL